MAHVMHRAQSQALGKSAFTAITNPAGVILAAPFKEPGGQSSTFSLPLQICILLFPVGHTSFLEFYVMIES